MPQKNSSCDYFSDIEFIMFGDATQHLASCNARMFSYYGIQLVYNGGISFSVDGSPAEYAEDPVLFFTYPGAPFSYGPSPGGGLFRSQIFICFKGDRVNKYLEKGLINLPKKGPYLIRIRDYSLLHNKMLGVIGLLNSPNPSFHARAVLKFEELLLFIREQCYGTSQFDCRYRDMIENLELKISENPRIDWDFSREAAALHISYAHFRRLFKRYTGFSPWNYVLECRLLNASKQVAMTNMRIGEITQESGFHDEFYFSRQFKRRFRKSPSDFRKHYGVPVS